MGLVEAARPPCQSTVSLAQPPTSALGATGNTTHERRKLRGRSGWVERGG